MERAWTASAFGSQVPLKVLGGECAQLGGKDLGESFLL